MNTSVHVFYTEGWDVEERNVTLLCGWFGCKLFPETLTWLLRHLPSGWLIISNKNLKMNISGNKLSRSSFLILNKPNLIILTTQKRLEIEQLPCEEFFSEQPQF